MAKTAEASSGLFFLHQREVVYVRSLGIDFRYPGLRYRRDHRPLVPFHDCVWPPSEVKTGATSISRQAACRGYGTDKRKQKRIKRIFRPSVFIRFPRFSKRVGPGSLKSS